MGFRRYDKYLVIKRADLKYLSNKQVGQLAYILDVIAAHREQVGKLRYNHYVVVNEEEPYSEQVWALIKEHWKKKDKVSIEARD